MSPLATSPESLLLDLLMREDERARLVAALDDPLTWIHLAAAAERHRVTLRLERRLRVLGQAPTPVRIAGAVARHRLEQHAAVVHAAREACGAARVPGVFVKLVTTGLDVGRDVDLLVPSTTRVARATRRGGPALDVHRGQLGFGAEHASFATQVIARARSVEWQDMTLRVPTLEDELLVLTLARVYMRPGVRLADLPAIDHLVRHPAMDPERLRRSAEEHALLPGLGCMLDLADQVAMRFRGAPIRTAEWMRLFPTHSWGPLSWRDGAWRPGIGRVAPPLFLHLLFASARRGDWHAVGAVARLPFTALAARRGRIAPEPSPRPSHA